MRTLRIIFDSITAKYLAGIAIALLLTACTSTEQRPVKQLTLAEAGIQQAEQAGAHQYSTESLSLAQKKFEQAKDAADDGEFKKAERLAAESILYSEYASVAADKAQTQEAAMALRQSTEKLRNEIQNNDAMEQ